MKFWSGIVTEKTAESRDFCVRVFGCGIVYEGEDDWFVLLQLGDSELGLMKPGLSFQAEVFQSAFDGRGGVWLTVDVEDAVAELARIEALGVAIQVPLRDEPWGDRHFVIVDPNGVPIDIAQRLAS